jgi:4-hydroxyproline epimerase
MQENGRSAAFPGSRRGAGLSESCAEIVMNSVAIPQDSRHFRKYDRAKNILLDFRGKEGTVRNIVIVDSHTGGEPTRVVLEGAPDLGSGSLAERLHLLRERYDWFRTAIVSEPRASEAMVGALLCEPTDPDCVTGVIYFDNATYLGMCGHGTIGLVATLAYLGRIGPGRHRIETPVGIVTAELHADGRVSVYNVPAYRHAENVRLVVEGYGQVSGEIAWGGNWFFLCEDHGQDLRFERLEVLTDCCWRIREALVREGLTGANGAEIDHIILYAPGTHGAHSKNFVLCPGKEYDRSPCGTGTSAKLACLAAAGRLQPGEVWVQESIIGSRFEATYTPAADGQILPCITGSASIMLEGKLIFEERDPFRWGIGHAQNL